MRFHRGLEGLGLGEKHRGKRKIRTVFWVTNTRWTPGKGREKWVACCMVKTMVRGDGVPGANRKHGWEEKKGDPRKRLKMKKGSDLHENPNGESRLTNPGKGDINMADLWVAKAEIVN